ncbi:hypothetical protein F5876DRAFT_80623 [Lentinula aff. lateritia]|uniref:Uncharacterized protein n=1 Tax=Lentinula aff. lateritia TaxID=2804960 RepID=A0ACC1TP68_9AGAR|nr:hypothetical protein F5876DRAFT_80623 [Lentinula aff. lateritia]
MPPAPPQPPTVIQVYTPFFVGTFLNIFLYGVAVSQVLYLFVLDTVNSFCDIGLLFEPLLLDFGNQDVVATSPWSEWDGPFFLHDEFEPECVRPCDLALRLDVISTALISTPVQIFMAWRIKIIMETIIPTVIINILAISSLTGSIWLAIAVSNTPQYAKFDDFRAAPSLWLISSAIADIAIACCLVYGLSKKRTGFAVLNDQIDRIIRVTVQTGSLTALTALIDVIVFLSVPNTMVFKVHKK